MLRGRTIKELLSDFPQIPNIRIAKPTERKSGPPERDPKLVEIVRTMKLAGLTYMEIGEALGFSRQNAQQCLRPKIENDGRCTRCGVYQQHLHRHHPDYKSDVIELICISCHTKVHAEHKNTLAH